MLAEVAARRRDGEYGFYRLGEQPETVKAIRRFAEGVGQAYDHVLVLGIGGSALGTKALVNALRPPAWNELDDDGREFTPRIHLLENVDPTTMAGALRRIDPRQVFVNVISKSGGTAETLAQYLKSRQAWLDQALGPDAATRHLALHDRPRQGSAQGPRRAGRHRHPGSAARRRGPLACSPVRAPATALRSGSTSRRCWPGPGRRWRARSRPISEGRTSCPLLRSPLGLPGPASRAKIHVLMPHSDRLRELSAWILEIQLWAESLGKKVDRRNFATIVCSARPRSPRSALTDQRSQVQLFMEGPFDKVVSFREGRAARPGTSGSPCPWPARGTLCTARSFLANCSTPSRRPASRASPEWDG
ncbi:MAG: hypothetical protein R2909_13230 [Gemmatimonadales bacterium]